MHFRWADHSQRSIEAALSDIAYCSTARPTAALQQHASTARCHVVGLRVQTARSLRSLREDSSSTPVQHQRDTQQVL